MEGTARDAMIMPTPLFINNIPSLDRLVALEYGQVDNGRPPSDLDHATQGVWRHVDGESKEPLGFVVLSLSECNLDGEEAAVLWGSETYDVPLFGLIEATIAEVISATRANLGKRPTLNRVFFERAVGKSGQEAIEDWRLCLTAGDSMAHFGLGCALCEVGEYREAFQHLRHYAHIAPVIAWNWRWYGYAAEKIGETEEARKAYRQAVAINEQYCQEETDAGELLERLGSK
jgi:tetratricopeptide (TPR) repeat protein